MSGDAPPFVTLVVASRLESGAATGALPGTPAGALPGTPTQPGHPETVHAGVIAGVTGAGEAVVALGDTAAGFPLRSTAKPFQLLPYLLDGLQGAEPVGEDVLGDLAVMMASHSGEPMHTERVADLLARSGLDVDALRCGTHLPFHEGTRRSLIRAGRKPTALHCNCSGKHAGMLAVCRHRGWPLESYTAPEHPLQQRIHRLVGVLSGIDASKLACTVDGCSLPSLVLPLARLARLYSYLARPASAPAVEGRPAARELELLFEAGTTCPALVGGSDALDTRLMRACRGRVFAKTGAAGLYAMALQPGADFPSGLGIAIKIADGDPDTRIRAVVAVAILRQLGIEGVAGDALDAVAESELRNLHMKAVGRIDPVFRLRP